MTNIGDERNETICYALKHGETRFRMSLGHRANIPLSSVVWLDLASLVGHV